MRMLRVLMSSHTVAIVLLGIHAGLLLVSIPRNFVTIDEAGHIVAGLSYVKTRKFTVYRVNPPLPKVLAVLPILPMDPKVNFDKLEDDPRHRPEYTLGPAFVPANPSRFFHMICRARAMGILWSILAGTIIYFWTIELYGGVGGCVSLALWCVEPYVLGHGGLVTSDVAAAAAGLAASFAFWRFLRSPNSRRASSRHRAIVAGSLLGLAALTKFTLLSLILILPILGALDRWLEWRGGATTMRHRSDTANLLLVILVSLLVINLGYLFQGSFRPLQDYPFISKALAGDNVAQSPTNGVGNRFRGTPLGMIRVPLPEDVLRGIDIQRFDFESRWRSYLRGEWRQQGWWYYYLYAMGVKLPLGSIGLVIWGSALVIIACNDRSRIRDEVMLLLTALALLIVISSQTGFSHHSRYAIVVLPYLFIIAGKTGRFFEGPGWHFTRLAAWGLLLWSTASSLWVYPHSLSYFNELAGGPERGHNHLLDSNIDWGQDLLNLKHWLDRHPKVKSLKLAYFGAVDPRLIGLSFEIPPPGPEVAGLMDRQAIGPLPGDYAISVNFLRGFKYFIYNGQGGSHQVAPNEFAYFQAFQPVDRAGHSIYIYHITPEQAETERRRRGLPPMPR